MTLIDALKRANGETWDTTLKWFFLNVISLILPIGITYLLLFGKNGAVDYTSPISHGELTLFSLSLLCSGFLILIKGIKVSGEDQINNDKKSSGINKFQQKLSNLIFPGSGWFLIFIFLWFALSIAIFCSTFAQNSSLTNYLQVQQVHIILSIIILSISFITTFLITLTDASLDNGRYVVTELYKKSNDQYQKKLEEQEWEE
jgi:hypothetical protein